jgi:hypothetical protein
MIEDQNVDEVIQYAIQSFADHQNKTFEDEDDGIRLSELYISLISHLVLLYFDKMDKLIDSFILKWGEIVLQSLKKENGEVEFVYLFAFSDLLLSNTQLFHEKFFPNVNIQGIETRLQVETLLHGKYFRLVDKKKLCQDLTFHFE